MSPMVSSFILSLPPMPSALGILPRALYIIPPVFLPLPSSDTHDQPGLGAQVAVQSRVEGKHLTLAEPNHRDFLLSPQCDFKA